jgi:hypothetical protein
VSWNPEPDAKRYQVEVSTTSGFNSRIDSHTVDGTTWAPDIDFTKKQARGVLYWRVAPVDERGGVGSFASGRFGGAPARCASPPAGKHRKAHSGHASKKTRACAKKRRASRHR